MVKAAADKFTKLKQQLLIHIIEALLTQKLLSKVEKFNFDVTTMKHLAHQRNNRI